MCTVMRITLVRPVQIPANRYKEVTEPEIIAAANSKASRLGLAVLEATYVRYSVMSCNPHLYFVLNAGEIMITRVMRCSGSFRDTRSL